MEGEGRGRREKGRRRDWVGEEESESHDWLGNTTHFDHSSSVYLNSMINSRVFEAVEMLKNNNLKKNLEMFMVRMSSLYPN